MAEVPQLTECTLVVVIGPVSSGKSWLIQQWLQTMERSVMIDTTAECIGTEDFDHIWWNPQELGKRLQENPYYYRIAYHPANIQEDFKWCVEYLWLVKPKQSRWLIIDEVHEIATAVSCPEPAERVFRYARHHLLGAVCSSQRLADVSKLMTDNCRMAVFFHTTEPNELDSFRKRYGKEVMEQIQNLRPCIYDDSTKTVIQEPEALLWVRGSGTRVVALGDKLKSAEPEPTIVEPPKETPSTEEGETEPCANLPEPQKPPEVPSLARPSGQKASQ